MSKSNVPDISGRPRSVRIALTALSLVLLSAVVFAQQEKNTKSAATPKPRTTQKPTPSPEPSPTPDTDIDAKTEAELLQAEDRFISAIQNRDVKVLEELLHAQYATAFEGQKRAITKSGVITRASAGRLAAYRVEKERKLIRSGDAFTVEGMANDSAREASDERPNEWVHVRRLWERQGDRWIATAQIITSAEVQEAQKEKQDPEEKEKKN
jgi:uncharacterized protein DUF4440